ncbi:MAG: efflux RND transporter permease subunit, partial [bacterium]
MILSRVAVNRPVFAVMVILALLVLGLTGFRALPVELFPEVDFPFVVVSAVYPGAAPETMETEVIKKIEDAVNPIDGVRHITSVCQEGFAYSVVEFALERNGDLAAQDVREKIAIVQADLPEDVEDLIVQRYDPGAQPVMSLVVTGPRSARELTYYAKEIVKKRIESVPGVGNVDLIGGEEREILVELRLDQLEAVNLSIAEVEAKVSVASLEIPAGRLEA